MKATSVKQRACAERWGSFPLGFFLLVTACLFPALEDWKGERGGSARGDLPRIGCGLGFSWFGSGALESAPVASLTRSDASLPGTTGIRRRRNVAWQDLLVG